tara:strand:+ start:167 stop:2338 length:2172 start_codon:yes stop_codon:yes gene_type:complete
MANEILIKFKPDGHKRVIEAINQLSAAQKKIEKNQSSYKKQVRLVEQRVRGNTDAHIRQGSILDKLKGKFAVIRNSLLLYAFGYTILSKTIGSVIRAYATQELAEKKLRQSYGSNISALTAQASALQQATAFGDEAIINAQSLLAAFIKEEEQLKRATVATLDLAAAKGMDLNTAADLVGKTLGSTTNSLSRYGIEVEGAVGSTERLDTLTNNIANTFGGQAKAQSDTLTGSVSQMKNAMGDAAEVIGELLSPVIISVAGFLKDAAEGAIKFLRGMTETSLQGTIRELEALGIEAEALMQLKNIQLNKELRVLDAEIKKVNTDMLTQEDISSRLNNITSERGDLLVKLGNIQAKINDQALAIMQQEITDVRARFMRERELMEDSNATRSDFQASKKREAETIQAMWDNFYKDQGENEKKRLSQLDTEEEALLEIASLLAKRLGIETQIFNITTGDKRKSDLEAQRKIIDDQIKLDDARKQLNIDQLRIEKEIIEITEEGRQGMLLEIEKQQEKLSLQKDFATENLKGLDLQLEKMKIDVEEARLIERKAEAEKAFQKIRNDGYVDGLRNLLVLSKELSKNEKQQKDIAFALAMVDAVRVGVGTYKNLTDAGMPVPIPGILAAIEFAAATAMANNVRKFEQGGVVGGRRHSQGGTLIEAEQGEFVMSRRAVESIGVNNLSRMNQGGGAINVNVTGNVLSSDFVEGELADKISEAVRKGVDFGIS